MRWSASGVVCGQMLSSAELIDAVPIILSLVVIESLLSVDNSLAIAAMARRVPAERRGTILNWGMAGAYAFRCICLLLAAWIIQSTWIKAVGAAYLLYLMCKELTKAPDELEDDGTPKGSVGATPVFQSVIVGILILDASLSVDNVVAAIAMSDQLWVVYTGVGIGILSLRLLAGWCMRLIERFPILESTAFLLVGFVGAVLTVELIGGFHLHPFFKFIGIAAITGLSLLYASNEAAKRALNPVIAVSRPVMTGVVRSVSFVFSPFKYLWGWSRG